MIDFDIIDGKLHNIVFTNGCNGNLKATVRCLREPIRSLNRKAFGLLRFKNTSCAISLRVQYGRRSANKLFCSRAAEDAYHKHKNEIVKSVRRLPGSFGAAGERAAPYRG